MKLNDKEITELAQSLAPKEQNAFPNHSDADIWVNGFIAGGKKFQIMSGWIQNCPHKRIVLEDNKYTCLDCGQDFELASQTPQIK